MTLEQIIAFVGLTPRISMVFGQLPKSPSGKLQKYKPRRQMKLMGDPTDYFGKWST